MLRRHLMRLLGGAAVAPAVAKAADRADMVAGRVPLPGAIGQAWGGAVGGVLSSGPPSGLTKLAYAALRREQHEYNERLSIRRSAWEMPLDPDLAAMPSCSETFLRHLQEQRLRQERRRMEELEWRIWPPDWMEG